METIDVNGAKYWLPANETDVMTLVNDAHANHEIICLRGSAHSFPLIGTLEKGPASGRPYKYVMLSKMNAVHIDVGKKQVTAQAGAHLGRDPWDPTKISTLENSLLYQLDQVGLAIPDLGGIIHQTVGGFLSTGSAGGSTQFAFEEGLISIDIIHAGPNGAQKTTFKRPSSNNPDDPFFGVGIATMGLFGVVVSATFQCVPKFNIKGKETISTVENCAIDLFGAGSGSKPSLEAFFQQTQYTRLVWWPQENVKKMVVWQAEQIPSGPDFKPKPYQEVPYIFNSPIPATVAADLLFSAIGQWPQWLKDMLGDTEECKTIIQMVDSGFYPLILPAMLDIFVPVDKPDKGPQQFQDVWWHGLPMDNQMSDRLFPVWFTELWIPLDKTQAVMNELLAFYNASTQNTLAFCCEIYAGKHSQFWLSPAYQTDVIRIDVFWFANNQGNPTDYYQKFWDLLAKYNFRPHWGKYLPAGDSAQGAPYLKSLYPKWDAWMRLRDQMDPNQIFVNDYWRAHLGIPTPTVRQVEAGRSSRLSRFFAVLRKILHL